MKRDSFTNGVIDQTLHWIDENIHERVTLDDLARKTGYSKWHFQRLFYARMSITAASYIRNAKLMRSVIDLKFSDRNIISIAEKYGFSSQQSYTRTFKHVMKCTPSLCRTRCDSSLTDMAPGDVCKACRQMFSHDE
ncbi:helix-turn-helix domain-containing protein [Shimwellia blattae]|uniref:Putative transcriptional regulator n=1 Tax=Shimwellia blattae (strain ATCC 29907 / DSM 4481 / JCM 1650 / NBRC 105725 / CDC 9005-74) TaxID=630626 RepID=I2BBW4_SHIBC|nr:helix-turn-helix domain-containing protein [Shimwellia blattae]AFJ48018.1 putative transcriptional regulator [Shimwellia blattae DSM 4481 = NBRC 105725]GAB81993.1 putative AraC family transcriptional regulator [Shimwellia blattae DSM 4481 = NBRC 105725]VDY65517.1 right oriC-binding transcriptional activator [Shimwellia blattae]VEC24826.1 right oriC-binding transcriptional activator [Shimwellia blattae]